MLKQIRNKRGMSVLEVMVAAGLASIVSLGIATMMQNSMLEQKKAMLLNTLKEQKARLEFLMRDQNAWNQTVNCTSSSTPACSTWNNNSTFNSMRANTAVTEVAYTSPMQVVLMDASGSATNLLGPSSTSGNGFTDTGAPCTTFNATAGSGNDACPISYRLMMGAKCASGSSCTNPQLKVVARLVFNPSTSGLLNRFRGLLNQTSGSSIADTVIDGKYDAVVKRTSAQANRAFSLTANFTGLVGSICTTGGAGSCTTSMTRHPLTAAVGWTVNDTNGLVTANAGGTFTLNEAGLYSCIVSVPAFATTGFKAQLDRISPTSTTIASGNTNAGKWSQSNAIIDAKFNVAAAGEIFDVKQQCDSVPTASAPYDTTVGNCSLGFVTTYGVSTVIVSINCYKADRSN